MKHEKQAHALLAASLLSTTLSTPPTASASGGGERREAVRAQTAYHGPVERIRQRLERLDLEAGRRAQIEAILERYRPRLQRLTEEMRQERRQLRALSQADNFDEERARELSDRLARVISEMMLTKTRMRHEVALHLDPAQRARLAAPAMRKDDDRDERREREDD